MVVVIFHISLSFFVFGSFSRMLAAIKKGGKSYGQGRLSQDKYEKKTLKCGIDPMIKIEIKLFQEFFGWIFFHPEGFNDRQNYAFNNKD